MRRRETNPCDGCRPQVGNPFPARVRSGSGRPLRLLASFVSLLFACCLPASALVRETGVADTCGNGGGILLPVLLSLTVSLSLLAIGLAVSLRRQRRKLRKSHEYLVRYITRNLELKKQIPGLKEPYAFDPPEITPEEFTKIIDNMLKRFLFLSLFALFALPLAAQETAPDSTYTFRFVPGKETFYVPYRDNAPVLDRLVRRLDSCRTRLEGGYAYVSVTGYVTPGADRAAAGRMGYLRNSHVKSELILRARLTERMFVTDRVIVGTAPEGLADVVVVTFPAPVEKVEQIAGREAAEKVLAYRDAARPEEAPTAAPPAESPHPEPAETLPTDGRDAAESSAAPATLPAAEPRTVSAPEAGPGFSLRADLLRWATLTPALGVEWRIGRSWSVQVNGSWTSWSWDDANRRYALWSVSPEVRHYVGAKKRGYVGVMFHAGHFNYKFSDTGRQGDFLGGGLTGGYLLRLNGALALDFSLGIGCTHADYDKYTVLDGARVKRGSGSRNYWGVNRVGITLVWQFNTLRK